MTLTQNDLREAVRVNELLIDEDTGEILSETDIGIDVLALQLKDGQENEKAWAQHNTLLKKAIGKKLDDANVKAAETPWGIACWRVQNRRSAKAESIDAVRDDLHRDEVAALYQCARDLDPKKLDVLRKEAMTSDALEAAIDTLIEEKTVSFVLLQPLRKTAPKLTRESVGTGDI